MKTMDKSTHNVNKIQDTIYYLHKENNVLSRIYEPRSVLSLSECTVLICILDQWCIH